MFCSRKLARFPKESGSAAKHAEPFCITSWRHIWATRITRLSKIKLAGITAKTDSQAIESFCLEILAQHDSTRERSCPI